MAGGELSGTEAYLQGKPCPKCGYVRKAADTNPDWQCPKCLIAYVKFDPEAAKLAAAQLGPRLVASGRELAIEAGADRSVYGLIAANLVALGVAVATGMTLRELIFVYWTQSVIIGISYFVRILSLRKFSTHGLTVDGAPLEETPHGKLKFALFTNFLFPYVGFHFMYLGYILFWADIAWGETTALGRALGPLSGFWLGALAFAAGHAFSLRENLARDRKTTVNLQTILLLPYVRVVPMHLTVFVGELLSTGPALFYGFVALKIVADVAMHVIEHHVLRTGRLLVGPIDIKTQ